jgi:hypothetical protein
MWPGEAGGKLFWLSLTKPLARVQELPRSLSRSTRKPQLWLMHLNPTRKEGINRTLRRPDCRECQGQGRISCSGNVPGLRKFAVGRCQVRMEQDHLKTDTIQPLPYTDLKGIFRKRPRGLSRKAFDDCVMFHLLTVFLNNAAEQERYYLTNICNKPQHVSMRQFQFVQRVKQLNSYIAQLPYWYHSPSAQPITILANVAFTEADLASHILRMCPITWQDCFNLHNKGMTPMGMCSLLMSLKAIERVCTQKKSNAQSGKKASNKGKKGNKQPGTESMAWVPKKACTKKHCNLCKKHGSMHAMHNTRDCHTYEKDRLEKVDIHVAKKKKKKLNPAKNSFAQLSKKLDKLKKAIKRQGTKWKKHHRDNSNSDSK